MFFENCAWPTVWDPVTTYSRLPDKPPAEFPVHRAAGFVANVLATPTAVGSASDGMITSGIAMPIATQSAYHISATVKYPTKEIQNVV